MWWIHHYSRTEWKSKDLEWKGEIQRTHEFLNCWWNGNIWKLILDSWNIKSENGINLCWLIKRKRNFQLSYTAGGDIVQFSPMETICRLLRKVSFNLLWDPEISLLGIYSQDTKALIQRTCTHIATFSSIVQLCY